MDAFYASVEQLDNPALSGRTVIVGGSAKSRGVVSAASYEARKFGVHSAMPMTRAIKLCPDAIVLPVRMERYAEMSRKIHNIFGHFTDLIEPISLDEAFLDVTGSVSLFGRAEKIGFAIKKAIKQETGLTASVGIGPNKFLAKLASDLEKPDGFVVITEANKQKVLGPLPVSRIWGVGRITQKKLQANSISTISQLREKTIEELKPIVGNYATVLLRLANGVDDREVEPYREPKSMSSEYTFAEDTEDSEVLLGVLLGEVEKVARRLRGERFKAKTMTVKFRYADFGTITRSKSVDYPSNTTETLWEVGRKIFKQWQVESSGALRLIGFEAAGLTPEDSGQQSLFADPKETKQKSLDRAVDKIRNRYGKDSLQRDIKT
jgi:DNA polymerase-4